MTTLTNLFLVSTVCFMCISFPNAKKRVLVLQLECRRYVVTLYMVPQSSFLVDTGFSRLKEGPSFQRVEKKIGQSFLFYTFLTETHQKDIVKKNSIFNAVCC